MEREPESGGARIWAEVVNEALRINDLYGRMGKVTANLNSCDGSGRFFIYRLGTNLQKGHLWVSYDFSILQSHYFLGVAFPAQPLMLHLWVLSDPLPGSPLLAL